MDEKILSYEIRSDRRLHHDSLLENQHCFEKRPAASRRTIREKERERERGRGKAITCSPSGFFFLANAVGYRLT